MKEDKTVPQLRFPEFTDAWKQRKFGDSFDFLQNNTLSRASLNDTSGCAKNVHYGDILVKFGESISAEKADLPFICEREILKKLSKSILKNGDVVIADTAEDMTTGKSCEIVDVDECMPVLAGLHTIPVRPKQKFGKYYLGYYLNSEAFHSQLIPLIQGIKVYSISKSSIKDTVVMFPDDVQEQEKIGSLFNRIDNTITLQQRKLNSLQKLKKGLLQKMFPKNGENIPEIRFPEFSDAWKQRKFGDVLVSIQTGTNKLGSDRNSGQPLLKMGNLQSGYFDLSKLEFLENKAEPENIVKQGDFFFNTRNTLELVGKGATWFGESNKYAFNSNIARFTLKDINTGFFNYLYNTNYVKKQIRARAMGTTSVAAIYPRSLKSVDIVIPNMEEQIKLSNLFMNLDSTINLQQRKLESLQKLKKGLLQQMFI